MRRCISCLSAVEIGRGPLRRVAHAARGIIELPAHLLELPPDLSNDRLEARFELSDRTRGVGLRLFAQALDLGQRRLRLAGRVAGKSAADLLGPGLRVGERVLDHAGIGPHHVVEVAALGVDRVQQADDGLVPVLQDRVDLGVRRIERLGGGEDRLTLVLEALGQIVDLRRAARSTPRAASGSAP